ncbi:MAG: hypothetical protein FWC46_02440 [Actinomycetia bacterium]|nr:hypothetical protein [Actinomycetes bacterium]
MAEIRKHNPGPTSDIGEQVRALLGETIRPVEPGSHGAAKAASPKDDPLYDPFDSGDAAGDPEAGIRLDFFVSADPLIGTVPADFIAWTADDAAPDDKEVS